MFLKLLLFDMKHDAQRNNYLVLGVFPLCSLVGSTQQEQSHFHQHAAQQVGNQALSLK